MEPTFLKVTCRPLDQALTQRLAGLLLWIFRNDRPTEPYIDRKIFKTSQFVAFSKVPGSVQIF